ncbi:MAG: futalosine hydrolase [Thermodesulfovibrionales bacterium]
MKNPINKIGVICAVDEECSLIAAALRNKNKRKTGSVGIIEGKIGDVRTVIAVAGIGKVNAAIGTMAIIYAVQPDALINAGIAGCYDTSGLEKGDIALADKEIYADEGISYGKRFKGMNEIGTPVLRSKGRSYFNEFASDRSLLALMKKDLKKANIDVRTGNFLTVSSVSGSKDQAEVLKKRFHGICENMEGAAVYHVAHAFQKPCIAVRGISNVAGVRNKRNWKIKAASENCQKAVIAFLESL